MNMTRIKSKHAGSPEEEPKDGCAMVQGFLVTAEKTTDTVFHNDRNQT